MDVFNVAQIDSLPVTATELGQTTRKDPLLSKVWRFTKYGWPQQISECLKPYWNRRDELSVEGDCVMWGIRVIVPKKLQGRLLQELHQVHQGVAKMKTIARSYIWWPGLDSCLESMARNCQPCRQTKSTQTVAPLHPWVWPSRPWQRVHIDYAGPFRGKMYFVLVDAHSKWPEVREMSEATATKTIQVLRELVAAYGLPQQIVSDNGSQFTSDEFAGFVKRNGIKHIRSSPYHPSTNGLAERFVQTFKKAMKASEGSGKPSSHRLADFLFLYRTTPHVTTNRSPSVLFLKRELRTRLDLLRPDTAIAVGEKQAAQKWAHDRRAKPREYSIGDSVLAKNYRNGPKWMAGVVVERKGPLSYVIQMEAGALWRRHVEQLKGLTCSAPGESETQGESEDMYVPTESLAPTLSGRACEGAGGPTAAVEPAQSHSAEPTGSRYPQRVRNPPQRYV